MIRFFKQKPIRIGIYYPASLALVTLACFWLIGSRDILVSAIANRPYAVLLENRPFFGLLSEKNEVVSSGGHKYKRIICLGDSNFYYPPDAVVPRNMNSKIHVSGMILESLGMRGVEPLPKISEWSYHGASMFDRYCMFYEAEKFSPDLLLIPVTWIAFGSPWTDNPDNFRPELSALVPIRSELPKDYVDPLRSADISAIKQLEHKINLYSIYPIGARTWLIDNLRSLLSRHVDAKTEAMPVSPESKAGEEPIPRTEEKTGRKEFAFSFPGPKSVRLHFPMTISASHPTLSNIRAVSYLASRHKIRILFFIWPVDSEFLKGVGGFDEEAFEESKSLIRKEIGNDHTYFADLSSLLEQEDFFDWHGHCTVEGRRKISEALASMVLEILSLETTEENSYAGADNPYTVSASGS